MEEKLKQEYYRLINLYRHTRSNAMKREILGNIVSTYEICEIYGIDIPEIKNYIVGYEESICIAESKKESDEFVEKLNNKIIKKLGKINADVHIIVNSKVNRKKYNKIVTNYLKTERKGLFDLYISISKRGRMFEIEVGEDLEDTEFFNISCHDIDTDIVIIDSYPTLLCYYGMVHELSHSNYNTKYYYYGKRASFDAFNDLSEVYPCYNELLLGEYLKKIKETSENYAVEYSKNEILLAGKDLLEYKDVHFLGRILALNFFDMYLEDKEKAEYNIEQFLRNYEGNDLRTNLNSYGLNEEKILSLKAIEGWKYD